ncbi:MAG TPA: mycothiol synthase [Cellulomonas sp.]
MGRVTDSPVETRTGPLDAATVDALRALAAAAAAQDGVPPLSEQPLLWLAGDEPAITHLLVRTDGPAPVGYAQVDLRDPAQAAAELVVHPAQRRRGAGTALLSAARAAATTSAPGRSGEPADAGDHDGPGALTVWAHGDLPAARALAVRLGLPVARELWQMRRPLDPADPPPSPVLPAGVTVRPFEPGRDEDGWVRLNARAFAHHPEQGRLTRTDLEQRMAEPWFDPAGLLLAERDGTPLAAGWTKVLPDADEGEVYALGVDPDAQGQGLGRVLTALMLRHLAERGLHQVLLYTEGDNLPAVGLYRAAGFERSAVDVAYRA